METKTEQRNIAVGWLPWLATTIIAPIALWFVTSSSDREKTRQEYVRIAIGILQPSDKLEKPQKALRGWAVELIQDSAPIKLSPESAKSLMEGTATFPVYQVGCMDPSATNYNSMAVSQTGVTCIYPSSRSR